MNIEMTKNSYLFQKGEMSLMSDYAKFSIKLAETLEWPKTNKSSERGDALDVSFLQNSA
jgi:hypothetical protein